MAIAYRAHTTAGGSAGTSVAPSKPSGTTDGDILIAYLVVGGASKTITPPSGWTLKDERQGDDPDGTTYLYWKWASSEPASWTWSWSGSAYGEIEVVAYSGAITSGDPIDVFSESVNSVNAHSSTVASAITTTVANTMLVLCIMSWDSGPFASSSGMTERYDGGASLNLALYDVAQASAGSSGTKTTTHANSGGNDTIVHLLALKPDTGGGSVEVTDQATAALTVADPTVQLGSLSLTDVAALVAGIVDPTVVLGSLALTDQAINVLGVVDPTVEIGSGSLAVTDVATLAAVVVDPTVVLGSTSATDVAIVVLGIVDPSVSVGGGADVAGHVDCADAAPMSAVGSVAGPTSAVGLDAASTSAVGSVAVV